MVAKIKVGKEKRVPTRAEVETVLDSFKSQKKNKAARNQDRESFLRQKFAHLSPQDLDEILSDLPSYPQYQHEDRASREV